MKLDRYTVPVCVVVPFGTAPGRVTAMMAELISEAVLDCGTYIGTDDALEQAALVKESGITVQDAKFDFTVEVG